MFKLNDPNISFILCSPELDNISLIENNNRNSSMVNLLYSLEYNLIAINSSHQSKLSRYYIGLSNINNDKLRNEAIFIMEQFSLNEIFLKYKKSENIIRINIAGEEFPNVINYYDNDFSKKIFLYEGISFTLNEQKRFAIPREKSDLKNGMIVEYLNNDNVWKERIINDINLEYDKTYKLMMKYEKIRIPI